MKKIANQILYNLKKEKTSFISFGVIILITALILNCAAVLLCQVDRAYDTKFEKLSTAMLNAIVPEVQNSSELEKAIDEIEKVEKIESYTAIMTEATVKDFNGADFSMNTVFYNIDDKRTLNNYELVSESKNNVDDPIYIPLYVSNFGGFALNDEIVYAIDGKSHSFTVAGVIEEMQYGNYGSGLLCAYLPKEEFAELADSYSDKAVVEYSMSVKSDASLDEVKDDVSKAIENKGVNLDFLKSWESGCFRWHNRSWRYLWFGLFSNLCFRNSCRECNAWWLRLNYYFFSWSCNNICGVLSFYNSLARILFFNSIMEQLVFQFPCGGQYLRNQKCKFRCSCCDNACQRLRTLAEYIYG